MPSSTTRSSFLNAGMPERASTTPGAASLRMQVPSHVGGTGASQHSSRTRGRREERVRVKCGWKANGKGHHSKPAALPTISAHRFPSVCVFGCSRVKCGSSRASGTLLVGQKWLQIECRRDCACGPLGLRANTRGRLGEMRARRPTGPVRRSRGGDTEASQGRRSAKVLREGRRTTTSRGAPRATGQGGR